ncbi:hypothetical protein TNCV_246031 [Trichonephila clavipes]|nr:hypothetical protein TNCV_246031 [Trichonephila clavipes]
MTWNDFSILKHDNVKPVQTKRLCQKRSKCQTKFENHVTKMSASHFYQKPHVSWDLDRNPGEGMDVCKCIAPVRHGDNLKVHS